MQDKSKRLLILDSDYKYFVLGKTKLKMASVSMEFGEGWGAGCLLLSIVFGIPLIRSFIIVAQRFQESTSSSDTLSLITFGIMLVMMSIIFVVFILAFVVMVACSAYGLWVRRKFHLLHTKSILLTGQLIDIDDKSHNRLHLVRKNVIATYQFTTPDGRILTRTQKYERKEAKLRPKPEPGIAVAVLYANDHAVMML